MDIYTIDNEDIILAEIADTETANDWNDCVRHYHNGYNA
jgi:hypothetical protein